MHNTAEKAISSWLGLHDQASASWIVDTHRNLVLGIARHAGAPRDLEEDAVQEVFLQAFRKLHLFQPREPFSHWLSVVARNTCCKLRRRWCRRHRQSVLFQSGAQDVSELDFPHEHSPDRRLMRKELTQSIKDGLRSFSSKERQTWKHLVFQSENVSEGAARLGIDPGHARVLLYRLRKHLRLKIADAAGNQFPAG